MNHIWLLVHVFGVVLFFGNVITAAFWKQRADARKNPEVIHSTMKNLMLADIVLTLPGLILIISSGFIMAIQNQIPLTSLNWLTVSLALFAITGIIWIVVLIPLQLAMIRHSKNLESENVLAQYTRTSKLWAAFGGVATVLPAIILFLMIFKIF